MNNYSLNETLTNSEDTTFRIVTNTVYLIIGIFGTLCNGLVICAYSRIKQNHGIFMFGKRYYHFQLIFSFR